MNSIRTQKYIDQNTKLATDFMVDKYTNVSVSNGTGYGGYEMRYGKGISVAKDVLEKNYGTITGTYADLQSKERKGQYLTNGNGTIISAGYGSADKELAKQIGSEAMPLGNAKGTNAGGVSNYVAKSPYLWYRKRWYYRVDKDTENQKLTLKDNTSGQINYLDTISYAYNAEGYLNNAEYIKTTFGINYDREDHDIISFADMYVGLENDSRINSVLNGCYSDERVKTIVRPFVEEKDRIKVTKVTFYGHASVQGNNASDEINKTRNNKLAKNRALTFKKWMVSKGFPGAENAQIDYVNGVQSKGNKNDVNDPITKVWRSASVVIEYEEGAVENAATNELPMTEWVKADGEEGGVMEKRIVTDRVEVPSSGQSKADIYTSVYNLTKNIYDNNPEIQRIVNKNNEGQAIDDGRSNRYLDESGNTVIETSHDLSERYDNEGEFFQLLERNEPFLHHLITDKVKYFDPAFHSISPEGFNARLTFLHQCTRQGSTVENSAFESGTAYNLAFGRPPVCVLRLGDFYYTKIIINSLNINYEQAQWDLNPEGIGVMPMFANVTIDFVFLGGSDLAGPISRLQNAVSFNYYANTSVYDNRAEMVEYDPQKTGKEIKFKGYRYPNTPNEKTKQKALISFGGSTDDFEGTSLFKDSGPEHEYDNIDGSIIKNS